MTTFLRPSRTLAGCLGTILALVSLLLYIQRSRPQLPVVTQELFTSNLQRWTTRGPADYDLEVVVGGPQPGTYRIEVRNKLARRAEFNGRQLPNDRTLGTWSVAGMFSNVERDLEQQSRATTDGNVSQLILRGEFESRWGYPVRYRRIDWGDQPAIDWEVTRFEVLSPHGSLPQSPPPPLTTSTSNPVD